MTLSLFETIDFLQFVSKIHLNPSTPSKHIEFIRVLPLYFSLCTGSNSIHSSKIPPQNQTLFFTNTPMSFYNHSSRKLSVIFHGVSPEIVRSSVWHRRPTLPLADTLIFTKLRHNFVRNAYMNSAKLSNMLYYYFTITSNKEY